MQYEIKKVFSQQVSTSNSLLAGASSLETEHDLDLTVENQHKSGADSTESVGASSLEQSGGALILHNLEEAVHGATVVPLRSRLLGLHLQATTNGIEGVRGVTGADGSNLGNGEGGQNTEESAVISPGVDSEERIVHAEVDSTVRNDTGNGDTEAIVETEEARRSPSSLHKTIPKAVERFLAGTHIRGESSTGIVQRVDDAEGASTGEASRCHVHKEEHTEVGLRAVLREESLDGVLEGKVEGLGGEITNNVGEISTPESIETLLLVHPNEAVHNASVARHLSALDKRVGILRLDDELDTFDRSSGGLIVSHEFSAIRQIYERIPWQ